MLYNKTWHLKYKEKIRTFHSTRQFVLPEHILNMIGEGKPDDYVVNLSASVIYKHFVNTILKKQVNIWHFTTYAISTHLLCWLLAFLTICNGTWWMVYIFYIEKCLSAYIYRGTSCYRPENWWVYRRAFQGWVNAFFVSHFMSYRAAKRRKLLHFHANRSVAMFRKNKKAT